MQQIYLKRMTKQDITRSVAICTESVESFWDVSLNATDEYTSIDVCHVDNPTSFPSGITIHKGYGGEKDWRICGSDWKKLYSDDNPDIGDIMLVRKLGFRRFSVEIINKDSSKYSFLNDFFTGNDNYVILTTDNSKDHRISDKTFVELNDSPFLSYLTALRTKPFMLLAGISGTGKSRIVRKLAQATTTQKYEKAEDRWKDNRPKNFELIQVKPNWHNSFDVVGFYSNISKKYEFTPFVEFIVKAWQDKNTPYFLCLDEMNLAPVEEYFAEFLSAIESRAIDENGEYVTDPIIKPFNKFGKDVCEDMLKQLLGEAHHTEANPLANQFSEKGLTLPPNLMVMGTVNMDETTFSFSRKVLDRAMSVEMNEVDYDKFLSGESEQFPLLTDINELLVKRPQQASEVKDGINGEIVVNYLKLINAVLDGTPFKLGYRAANEAMLYVSASQDFEGNQFNIATALDEFTLMKILSRIEGDKRSIGDKLDELQTVITESYPKSNKKLREMAVTLKNKQFVSYWT